MSDDHAGTTLAVYLTEAHVQMGSPTYRTMEAATGMSRTTISNALTGRTAFPRPGNLARLVEYLGADKEKAFALMRYAQTQASAGEPHRTSADLHAELVAIRELLQMIADRLAPG